MPLRAACDSDFFHQLEKRRAESDTAGVAPGDSGRRPDTVGYAADSLLAGRADGATKQFELRKWSASTDGALPANGGDQIDESGGMPVRLERDVEYNATLLVKRISDSESEAEYQIVSRPAAPLSNADPR
jgi:hypothetical protein